MNRGTILSSFSSTLLPQVSVSFSFAWGLKCNRQIGSRRVFLESRIWLKYGVGLGQVQKNLTGNGIWLQPRKWGIPLGTECRILYHEKNGGCNLGFSWKRSWNAGISANTTSKTERLISSYTQINVYLNYWTKFLFHSCQPSKALKFNRQLSNQLSPHWAPLLVHQHSCCEQSWKPVILR